MPVLKFTVSEIKDLISEKYCIKKEALSIVLFSQGEHSDKRDHAA